MKSPSVPVAARCPECGCLPPGHKINCRTDNEKARAYQNKLERDYQAKKKATIPAAAIERLIEKWESKKESCLRAAKNSGNAIYESDAEIFNECINELRALLPSQRKPK